MCSKVWLWSTLCAFGVLQSTYITGQACCSGGTPITNNLQPVVAGEKQLVLLLNADRNFLDDLVHESRTLSANNRQRITNALITRLSYTMSRRWGVSLMLSYVSQVERADNPTGQGQSTMRASGFGDMVTTLQYAWYTSPTFSGTIAGGVKMPTGPVDRRDSDTGLFLHPDLQPGSGAWEGLLVAHVAGKWVRTFIDYEALATFRLTENADRYDGQQKYKFGNELQLIAAAYRPIFLDRHILVPGAGFKFRHTAVDKLNDQEAPNTGGYWTYVTPSVRVAFPGSLSVEIYADFPLFRDLAGTQLTTSYRLGVSAVYTFAFGRPEDRVAPPTGI